MAEAAGDLCKRVAQETIRKILETSGEPRIQTLLDMVTASRISELAKVLTPEMVAQLREILASANVEIRTLALADLVEDYGVSGGRPDRRPAQATSRAAPQAVRRGEAVDREQKRIRFLLR